MTTTDVTVRVRLVSDGGLTPQDTISAFAAAVDKAVRGSFGPSDVTDHIVTYIDYPGRAVIASLEDTEINLAHAQEDSDLLEEITTLTFEKREQYDREKAEREAKAAAEKEKAEAKAK